ncbi:MAG: hypothetical protein WAW81_02855 [Minisyncoccia bacterium]
MITIYIFTISGLSIATLVFTKRLEEKRRKQFFISRAISRGDIHAREFYQKAVHLYSEGKEKVIFFYRRQIPIHSKNSLNKFLSYVAERREQYLNNMRDSRLLKKSDGISEFIKNMSDVEKGNGEIHDGLEDGSQNAEEK